MLDAKPAELTTVLEVSVRPGRIEVRGASSSGSCRDTAALALVWAIGRLQVELKETLERPGGGSVTVD